MRLAIYGTGGMAREVAPLATERLSAVGDDIVFVDDNPSAPRICNDRPVIDFTELQESQHRSRKIVVAIGDGRVRQRIEERCLAVGLDLSTLIAKSARVYDQVSIGAGSVLCDFAVVTSNVRIGKSFQSNIASHVMHDCIIGDYVTFAPRVSCNGNVHIGDFAYLGAGATIINGKPDEPLTIGEGAVVGMGAVVIRPVPAYGVVVGNPARVVRILPH